MQWKPDKSKPICPQISEQLCLRIAMGEFRAGERLLSVREVALSAGVNPNTVQRSFETLEQEGILYSVRGSGWYVAEDITPARAALERMWEEKTAAYVQDMTALGMDLGEVKKYVAAWLPKEDAE
ncbi:MAG: GntR family transcriptional regulator [Ruminococcaceae bacterium]|nr:GntR family transcriptional regulator [Oscillospiraceae bacterium]